MDANTRWAMIQPLLGEVKRLFGGDAVRLCVIVHDVRNPFFGDSFIGELDIEQAEECLRRAKARRAQQIGDGTPVIIGSLKNGG